MYLEYELIILLSKPQLSCKDKEVLLKLSNTNLNWKMIFEKLKRHRTISIAFYHLKINNLENIIPCEILKEFKEKFERYKVKQELYLQEINCIIKEFQKSHIKFCILKGMVLQELLYPINTRTYKDIDILINKNDYFEVCKILGEYGFFNNKDLSRIENKKERLFLLLNTYEFPEFKKELMVENQKFNLYIDVQHTHTLSNKMGYVIDSSNELNQSEDIIVNDVIFPRQRIDYLLLHLCTHTFGDCTTISEIVLGKAFRLRNFGDIFGLVEKYSDEYSSDCFYDLVRQTHTIKPVYFCLYYCTQIYQVSNAFKKIIKKLENQLTDYSFINQYGFENGSDGVLNWECDLVSKLFSDESINEVKKNAKNNIKKYSNYDTRISK